VLSGRGLCDGLITRPEESYRVWRLVVCDQETSKTRRLKARYRAVKIQPQWVVTAGKQTNNKQQWKCIPRMAVGIMADLWRGFWIRETGTGQQVAQLHDRYMICEEFVYVVLGLQ
jgi:hypothetical protein